MKKEQIFEIMAQYPDIPVFEFEGRCVDCQCPVTVTIVRIHDYSIVEYADSFDVYGGAVHADKDFFKTDIFKVKCELCFSDDPRFGGKCEVYSRVVGYLRPIKNWNSGQRAQFSKRKMMTTNSI